MEEEDDNQAAAAHAFTPTAGPEPEAGDGVFFTEEGVEFDVIVRGYEEWEHPTTICGFIVPCPSCSAPIRRRGVKPTWVFQRVRCKYCRCSHEIQKSECLSDFRHGPSIHGAILHFVVCLEGREVPATVGTRTGLFPFQFRPGQRERFQVERARWQRYVEALTAADSVQFDSQDLSVVEDVNTG